MFLFSSEGTRDVVGSGVVIGGESVRGFELVMFFESVMVLCVVFKRFHMNLGKHFGNNHLGTNFFVETEVGVSVGTEVGTDV